MSDPAKPSAEKKTPICPDPTPSARRRKGRIDNLLPPSCRSRGALPTETIRYSPSAVPRCHPPNPQRRAHRRAEKTTIAVVGGGSVRRSLHRYMYIARRDPGSRPGPRPAFFFFFFGEAAPQSHRNGLRDGIPLSRGVRRVTDVHSRNEPRSATCAPRPRPACCSAGPAREDGRS
jgi:hypothetical protein